MHRHVYIPFSNCYSLVNYLHDIKLNRGDLSNLCSPHISFAMPFVVDDVHTRRSLGADVGMRHASIILNEELSKNATLGLARMNLLLNSRLGLFRRESHRHGQICNGNRRTMPLLSPWVRMMFPEPYRFTSLKRLLDGILASQLMLAGMPPTFWV